MSDDVIAEDLFVVTLDGPVDRDAVAGDLGSHAPQGSPVGIVGTGTILAPGAGAGHFVVASEVWTLPSSPGDEARSVPGAPPARPGLPGRSLNSAEAIAHELRARGYDVSVGPVASIAPAGAGDPAVATFMDDTPTLERLGALGAIAVVESEELATLVEAVWRDARPAAVVLVQAPFASRHCAHALDGQDDDPGERVQALEAAAEVVREWARAHLARRVVLAAPRSFCAGVERAIEIVERALAHFGSPVYVRRQIVHNSHVVGRLAKMGAIFVEELDEVPDDSVVVLAAHGVSPSVRAEAEARARVTVVDATCPLVAKVHHEARRFAARGYTIALVGHADHEEVIGTLGEAPERTHVVSTPADVAELELEPGSSVAYLTQTTLASDETQSVVDALRARFGDVVGPSSDDICYATQNRQDAVRAIAPECDLILVVGSTNSSNTARLVEVARREGCRAELVEDASQLRLSWLDGARTVGLTAGASAPEPLVVDVVEALARLGPLEVDERRTTSETVRFPLPLKVR